MVEVLVEENEVLSDEDDDVLVEAELLLVNEELVLIELEVLCDVVVLVEVVPRPRTKAAAPMTTMIITMTAIMTL